MCPQKLSEWFSVYFDGETIPKRDKDFALSEHTSPQGYKTILTISRLEFPRVEFTQWHIFFPMLIFMTSYIIL